MAGENLNFDPNTQLPPQATGGLPGAAAEAADIAPAQTAQDVLRTAAYGDQGAQQYADLVSAGQTAQTPTPSAPPPAARRRFRH